MTTTIETLTEEQIIALMNEAIVAGGASMVDDCELAIDATADRAERDAARRRIVEAINHAASHD
jgi:hypothetical protein